MTKPNKLKWWLAWIFWDVAMVWPYGKVSLWLIGKCGHVYAFKNYQEWNEHYKLFVQGGDDDTNEK